MDQTCSLQLLEGPSSPGALGTLLGWSQLVVSVTTGVGRLISPVFASASSLPGSWSRCIAFAASLCDLATHPDHSRSFIGRSAGRGVLFGHRSYFRGHKDVIGANPRHYREICAELLRIFCGEYPASRSTRDSYRVTGAALGFEKSTPEIRRKQTPSRPTRPTPDALTEAVFGVCVMETTSVTMDMATATHSVRRRRNSQARSTPSGSPPWNGADLPFLPVPTWRASGVAMYSYRYKLHISVLGKRDRSYTGPPSVAAAVAQSACCGTLGVKDVARQRQRQRRMPASDPASLPVSTSASALAPKGRLTRSVIRRSLSRRNFRRLKKSGRVTERMGIGLRKQWKQEKGTSFQVTQASPCKPDTMGSVPVFADVAAVSMPTISMVHAIDDGSAVMAMEPALQMPKPKVLIIATGGTIAGRGASATDSSGYQSAVICVKDLVKAVPELMTVAEISTLQLCEVGSPDLPSSTLVELSQRIQTELARDDLDAVVVTHGTDTLEETSFFLDLTVLTPKPVVVTGSMLPSTSLSADGPKNLFNAVCVGASPASRDRGVLVVFNSNVMPARFTVKSDANMIHTFDPGHQGCLGQLVDDTPLYYWPPARPLGHRHIDITALPPSAGLPKVGVLYGHLGVDDLIFQTYVKGGVAGLVLAGMGAGCWTHQGEEELERVIGRNRPGAGPDAEPLIPVVTSSRCGRGCVTLKRNLFGVPDWVVRSGFLNPAKACKLLQVCLAVGMSHQEIRSAFSIYPCVA